MTGRKSSLTAPGIDSKPVIATWMIPDHRSTMRNTTPTTNMAAVMPRNASAALGERYPARASQRLKGPRSPTSAGSAGASSRAVKSSSRPRADAANDPGAKPHGHDEKPEDHEEQQRRRVHETPQYFKRLSHEVQKIPNRLEDDGSRDHGAPDRRREELLHAGRVGPPHQQADEVGRAQDGHGRGPRLDGQRADPAPSSIRSRMIRPTVASVGARLPPTS